MIKTKEIDKDIYSKVEIALDALWEIYGNGYGTPQERLMIELQTWLEENK